MKKLHLLLLAAFVFVHCKNQADSAAAARMGDSNPIP